MENEGTTRGRGGRRGRRGRGAAAAVKPKAGRGRGRGRGRPKKMIIESDDDDEQQIETSETVDNMVEIMDEPQSESSILGIVDKELGKIKKESEFSIDDDISQLVPPTFSTLSTGPPQPMVELDWNHNYNPSAQSVPNPNIHMCVGCLLPIRLYGRLIPCKHVFCYLCATKHDGKCSVCNDNVHRIEQAHLGSVHMCNHEGSRYGFDGCRRTYLSQRDLQAHINHRHKPRSSVSTSEHLHGSPRVKPDSQSMLVPSPENPPSTPTSTGSRYDRKSSLYTNYSRSGWQNFRQF